jgi:phage/conjugal plasmid C-4 type zinc finger TraR family protein
MADQADIAHERVEEMLADRLSRRVRYAGRSARRCVDCGEPIPAVRRRSVPGVQYCVACQEVRERRARG